MTACDAPVTVGYFARRNLAQLRRWHVGCIVLFGSMLTGGCVLPESLEVVDDVEPNYAPTVVRAMPPDTERVGMNIGASREFTLTIEDLNLNDRLYVRFFIDYAQPSGSQVAPPVQQIGPIFPPVNPRPGDFTRLPISPQFGCTDDPRLQGRAIFLARGTPHELKAVIADREFIDLGVSSSQFRILPGAARQTQIAWTVQCGPAAP